MSITIDDISRARQNASIRTTDFCKAVKIVLPVLEALAAKTKGWKFWLWGINALVAGLKAYTKIFCVTINTPNIEA